MAPFSVVMEPPARCMFADAAKVPRFTYSKSNELTELSPDAKLEAKAPENGDFTVESDRAIMGVFQTMVGSITTRIDRGVSFIVADSKQLMTQDKPQ